MNQLSKNAQVLKFFAQQCRTLGIGRTRLLKLAYLADLEARKYLGRPITSFDYWWHHHGPFDAAFYGAVDELKTAGHAEEAEVRWDSGRVNKLVDTGMPAVFDFSTAELMILSYVLDRFRQKGLKELLDDIVYQTEPMLAAQAQGAGSRLPMEAQDFRMRDKLGFNPEEALAVFSTAERGEYLTAPDFFNAARAEAALSDSGGDSRLRA